MEYSYGNFNYLDTTFIFLSIFLLINLILIFVNKVTVFYTFSISAICFIISALLMWALGVMKDEFSTGTNFISTYFPWGILLWSILNSFIHSMKNDWNNKKAKW